MEIKPCPFCGGEVAPQQGKKILGIPGKYYLKCWSDDCEVNPGIDRPHDTEEAIITAWNKRTNNTVEPLDAN